MIPKIIHYCWFGGKPIPKKLQRIMKTWDKLEGYQIKRWDETNCDLESIPYLKNALANKKWANLSNYIRLDVLKRYGGIYLDTDIEIIKPFDNILSQPAFVGFEDKFIAWDGCINNAVLGAIPNHWFISLLESSLLKQFDGEEEAHLSSPNLTTSCLKTLGLNVYKEQAINDLKIYPIEYFYPYSWYEIFKPELITKNTYCIHHFQQSWKKDITKDGALNLLKKKYYLYKWEWLKMKKKF